MEEREIEAFISKSLDDGFTADEIETFLGEKNIEERKIQNALRNLQNRRNRRPQQTQPPERRPRNSGRRQNPRRPSQGRHKDVINSVELTDDSYTVKQRLLFNRYHVYDSDDNLILKAKQKLFKLKEEFPFMNPEGDVVFRIKAESIVDAGGDYTVIDEKTEDPIILLDKKYTLFRHKWKIRDADTEKLLAKVESHNQTVELLRWIGNLIPRFPNLFGLIPHQYDLETREGDTLASLKGRLHLRDIYDLEIENSGNVPKEALVAGAIAIDALEGN